MQVVALILHPGAGDYVELRLSENADGTYQALRLEREEDDNEVKVTAPVDSIDTAAELIVMLDITIDMAGVSSPDLSTLVVGDYLEVEGTWNGDIITATEAEYEHDYDDDSQVSWLRSVIAVIIRIIIRVVAVIIRIII